jgi:hypothetical protein
MVDLQYKSLQYKSQPSPDSPAEPVLAVNGFGVVSLGVSLVVFSASTSA